VSQSRYVLLAVLSTLFFFTMAALFAVTSPPFSGPDELKHFNSVSRLAAGGGWPLPYEAPVMGATRVAQREAGRVADENGEKTVMDPDLRSDFLGASTLPDAGMDNTVHHPPAYYITQAVILRAADGDRLRWDDAMMIVRIVSALMLSLAVPFVIGAARWITGSRMAGLLGGIGLLLIPFLTNLGGFVSNDGLLIAAMSACLYLLVRPWSAPPAIPVAPILAGLALGLALLTKGTALLALPAVVVLAFLATSSPRRSWPARIALTALPAAAGLLIGGWWWVRNLLVLGKVQPSVYGATIDEFPGVRNPDYDFAFFNARFWDRLNDTFWGRGGQAQIALPGELVSAAGVTIVLVSILVLALGQRRRTIGALLLYPVALIAILFANAHDIYWNFGPSNRGIQGRYLYPGIVAFGAVIANAWFLLQRRVHGDRMATLAAAVLTLVACVINGLGFAWVFGRTWASAGSEWVDQVRTAAYSTGVDPAVIVVIASAAIVVALTLVALVATSWAGDRSTADHTGGGPMEPAKPADEGWIARVARYS
jgi:hypothetical protein